MKSQCNIHLITNRFAQIILASFFPWLMLGHISPVDSYSLELLYTKEERKNPTNCRAASGKQVVSSDNVVSDSALPLLIFWTRQGVAQCTL